MEQLLTSWAKQQVDFEPYRDIIQDKLIFVMNWKPNRAPWMPADEEKPTERLPVYAPPPAHRGWFPGRAPDDEPSDPERGSAEIDDTIDDEDPTVIITTRLSPQINETLH